MKNTIDIIRRVGQRLFFSAIAVSFCTNIYAQEVDDDASGDDEVEVGKAPKRTQQVDKNTLVQLAGIVIDDATKLPVAGVRVQALGDNRYTAMTNAKGEFSVAIPDFCTSLYVSSPSYMAQQVAVRSNDTMQRVRIKLISKKFRNMYVDATDYMASSTYKVKGGGLFLTRKFMLISEVICVL